MTQSIIDIGDAPNDGTGDPVREAFNKCNNNFTELYAGSGGGGSGGGFTASSTPPVTPTAGDHWYDLSTGVLSIYVNDGTSSQWVMVSPSGGGGVGGVPQGRLTLDPAAPVMTTTWVGSTSIYYLPYIGRLVPVFDGTNVAMTSIGTGLTASTTDTTKNPAAIGVNKVNDWFIWNDAGAIRLSHGPDWTDDTTRALVLGLFNGLWVNGAAITNGPAGGSGTYVGTTRSNASSLLVWQYGAVGSPPTEVLLGIWNAYNRVNVTSFTGESATNWTYASTTPHPANSRTTYRASVVVGLAEDSLAGVYSAHAAQNTVGGTIGIGYDSTSALSANSSAQAASTTLQSAVTAQIAVVPAIGWHYIQALEAATTAGTAAFYGAFQLSMSKLFILFRM